MPDVHDVGGRARPSSPARLLVLRSPASRGELLFRHLPAAAVSGGLLGLALLGPLLPAVPTVCTFLRFTGVPCPLCGGTRSFVAMAYGHYAYAWQNSPLAVGLFLAAVGVFAWHSVALFSGQCMSRGSWLNLGKPWRKRLFISLVILLVLANWAYRIQAGMQ